MTILSSINKNIKNFILSKLNNFIKLSLDWIEKSLIRKLIATLIYMIILAIIVDQITSILDPSPLESGMKLYEEGKYGFANESFHKAILDDPNSEKAWFYSGLVLLQMEKYNESIDSFNMTTRINPTNIDAWLNTGLAYEYLRQYEKALKCFYIVTNISQSNGQGWSDISRVYLKLDLINESKEAALKAHNLGYGYPYEVKIYLRVE